MIVQNQKMFLYESGAGAAAVAVGNEAGVMYYEVSPHPSFTALDGAVWDAKPFSWGQHYAVPFDEAAFDAHLRRRREAAGITLEATVEKFRRAGFKLTDAEIEAAASTFPKTLAATSYDQRRGEERRK